MTSFYALYIMFYRNGLVVKEAMHKLRKLLDDLGMVKGLRRDEKDPEEFINLILDSVFKVPPSFLLRYVT